MKHKQISLFLSFLFLTSCQAGNALERSYKEYRNVLSFKDDTFNILQLTDIHWTYVTKIKEAKDYLQALFLDAKKEKGHVDLVTITGDVFLEANKSIVEELFSFLSSWDTPIAVTYGNHDKEGEWNLDWMNKMVSTSKNFIAKTLSDNVYGDTNYYIDIQDGENTLWQVYMIDSNSLAPKDVLKYQYDCIHENQVKWMKGIADASKKGSSYLPSLGFFHIPPKEYKFAEEALKKDPSKVLLGKNDEKACPTLIDSSFFKTAKEINMKGMFFGHDHANDSVTKYEGMLMGYGVKSNTELYYYKDEKGFTKTGYAFYELRKDQSWSIQHTYMDYSTREVRRSSIWESTL